ncbi:hypothetical protein KKC13_03440 [bacterium]|nr:hypothetical protein [bacterium]MBU1957379.1 hypothetical protein [bacterium]
MKTYLIFFILYIPIAVWGTKIEYTNLTYQIIPTQKASKKKSYYTLTSKYHLKNFSKKDTPSLLLNRKQYMLKNNYYAEGRFKTSMTNLIYKKAYVLGGKVYLLDVMGQINKSQVKAKEVVYDGYKSYLLKKCEIQTKSKIYRRNKMTLKEK